MNMIRATSSSQGAATAGDLSAPAFVAGPVSPSATVPLADTAPEPDAPPPVIGSGAPIPPFVPAFLHKDEPAKPINPVCQRAQRGERCPLSHSNDVWCARQECVSAAASLKRVDREREAAA